MTRLGKKITITFVDYTAAFDTISHKFIDRALKEAGATVKIRSIFRAVHKAVSTCVTTKSSDGVIKSNSFKTRRGVLQGDVTSPLCFILALQLILKLHDNGPK